MVVELPVFWIIVTNIAAWFIIHMSLSLLMIKVSDEYYRRPHFGFRTFQWERGGRIWQDIFRLRTWKKYLPDSSSLIQDAYNLSHLKQINLNSLDKIIIETKRAEQTHWLSILPAFLFFIWNPFWAGCLMILYALLFNLPFIIIQRYNRPRLRRIYQKYSIKLS